MIRLTRAVIIAVAVSLNRVAVVVGVHGNLPWFMVPYDTVETMSAAWLLGVERPPQFADRLSASVALPFFGGELWGSLGTLVRPLAWPFALGSTFGALILAAISYNLAWPAIAAGRRRLHLRHGNQGDAG